ncbi:peptide-methionine (R)-S-oxide reductase MsrB [Parvibaculum sp.]|jgi:peptide-methionine (R)-S-oxide reductase|uniref:peptide-methionine (R)-S-oxide reductase MsrB n=1 Tax=Parvibaculum sp. TaxID=2024848 RepID=UPI0025EC298B|nr:peptide-methionine (R)-S-oxide reductase MsrB [Parvibaculum sp.]
MMSRRMFLGGTAVAGALAAMGIALRDGKAEAAGGSAFEVIKTEAEWKELLTPEQFYVLREEGTERPGSSPLNKEKRAGTFHCAGCNLALFPSRTKYESGTGWPSFYAPLDDAIRTSEDRTFFMTRTEVHCRRCGGHLGHVFDDGPKPTGKRYCMNGVAMTFEPSGAA